MNIHLSEKSEKLNHNIFKNCIMCGLCVQNCEMLKTYTTSPKVLFNKAMDHKIPFSCYLCDHCKSICPKGIDLKSAFFSMRHDAQEQTKIKTPLVDRHQKNSFSSFFTSKVKANKKIFFPGCSLSAHDPNLVMKIYEHIKDKDMGIWTNCCGSPTYTLGKKAAFDQQLTSLIDGFKLNGVTEIVVACQNCYKIFKEHTHIKTTSIFEILNELPLPKITYTDDKTWVLHDPCPTRQYKVIHDSVRELLSKLSINYTEFDFNRDQTQCCGSGAMVRVTHKVIALKQAHNRAFQSEAESIITYCQECVESLGEKKETRHLLELIFNHGLSKKTNHTLKKWTNRRLLKIRIEKDQTSSS